MKSLKILTVNLKIFKDYFMSRNLLLKSLVATTTVAIMTTSVQAKENLIVDNIVSTIGFKKGSSGSTGGYLKFTAVDQNINLAYLGSISYDQLNKDTSLALVKSTVGIIVDEQVLLSAGIGAIKSNYNKKNTKASATVSKNSIISAVGIAGVNLMDVVTADIYFKDHDNYGLNTDISPYSTSTDLGEIDFKVYADFNTIDAYLYSNYGVAVELSF
jgi:hypothetical protein